MKMTVMMKLAMIITALLAMIQSFLFFGFPIPFNQWLNEVGFIHWILLHLQCDFTV